MNKQICSTIAMSGLLLLMSSIFNSCIQEQTFSKATIETNQVTSVTEATATCGGIISADGGSDVTARGVCWSTSPNPTIESDTTIDAAGTGPFTSVMKGLSQFRTFYVRAYATNKGGTAYGLQMTFTTKTLTFTTIPASFIMAESAISGGMISSDGDSLTIMDRGVCWNTLPYPTIADSSTHDGRGKGSFTSTLTGLKPFTTYFARAFVTNSIGTTYGNDISFTTQNGIIGLATEQATLITASSALLSANISGDGGSFITECGFCYNTSLNPSLANKKVYSGGNSGLITLSLIGLSANTTYHVWAYGINSVDTTFSNEIILKTRDGIIGLNTPVASSISASNATITGAITDDGGSQISECGFCWSTTTKPSLANKRIYVGEKSGIISLELLGLSANTTYYVWLYGINKVDTTYSEEVIVKTRDGIVNFGNPVVSSKSSRTVTLTGTLTDDGGSPISSCGFSWYSSTNPSNVSYKSVSSNDGSINCTLSDLLPETTYFVKEYAVNGIGYSYSNEISFTTDSEPSGDGTQAKPYTIAQAKAKQTETGKWVTGYIVGYINTTSFTYTYSATGAVTTNMIIADSPTENVDDNCMPVQLATGSIRTALNLMDKPANLGKKVNIKGDLLTYFSVPGLKTLTAYVLEDEVPVVEPTTIFSEPFTGTLGSFTTASVIGDQLWVGSSYGAIMTGFVSSVYNKNEDWLISPAINLTGKTSAVLSFMHTINKGVVANMLANHTLWVSTNYTSGAPSTATWTQVAIPTYPGGADWTFVNSGNISLPASVLGNSNCRIAFKYLCSTTEASSWEIKTLQIVP